MLATTAGTVTDKPSMIILDTIIAWPAPEAQDTGASHGSALGEDEVAATKKILGFDPAVSFPVEDAVLEHTRSVVERGRQALGEGNAARALELFDDGITAAWIWECTPGAWPSARTAWAS